jgi:hypothetical protein
MPTMPELREKIVEIVESGNCARIFIGAPGSVIRGIFMSREMKDNFRQSNSFDH